MLALLDLIPKWVWAALVATLAATSCKLKWENGELSIEIEKGKTYVAQLEASISKANAVASENAAENERRVRSAEASARKRADVLSADAAAARSELDRLRDALSSYTARGLTAKAESLAPGLDTTDPIPDLFLQCTARYVDLAGKADGHVNDVKTLIEAWPK